MQKILFIFLFISSFSFAQNTKEIVTILFDSNEVLIKSSEKEKLVSFFSNENLIIQAITIEGFCDDIGTSENNLILSSNRAKSVAEFLKRNLIYLRILSLEKEKLHYQLIHQKKKLEKTIEKQ